MKTLPEELNPHPELDEFWEKWNTYSDETLVEAPVYISQCPLPLQAKQKRLAIIQTIRTQRLIHGIQTP